MTHEGPSESADAAAPSPAAEARGRRVVESLGVAPAVLGMPLAEPWRRLAALTVDLAVVAGLSFLSAPWLGLGTGLVLIVLFGGSRTSPLPLKILRWCCRPVGATLLALSALALGHSPLTRGDLNLDVFTGTGESAALRETVLVSPDAGTRELRSANERLQDQVGRLKSEVRELRAARESWAYQARVFANALGVTFGWSGVYFTLAAGFLSGATLGKLVFGIRAVKTHGGPFTFFDGFVRHGGYVAGVAMGLTGFLQVLWDANRRGVEDRIGDTVVVRTRD
jgi:uncharacterized RDD family membrane protein YckC